MHHCVVWPCRSQSLPPPPPLGLVPRPCAKPPLRHTKQSLAPMQSGNMCLCLMTRFPHPFHLHLRSAHLNSPLLSAFWGFLQAGQILTQQHCDNTPGTDPLFLPHTAHECLCPSNSCDCQVHRVSGSHMAL